MAFSVTIASLAVMLSLHIGLLAALTAVRWIRGRRMLARAR